MNMNVDDGLLVLSLCVLAHALANRLPLTRWSTYLAIGMTALAVVVVIVMLVVAVR